MSEWKEYEMTEAQEAALLEACKPVPYLVAGGMEPRSPRDNAIDAWRALGKEMGFVWDTAEPIPGKGRRFFTAKAA